MTKNSVGMQVYDIAEQLNGNKKVSHSGKSV